MNNNQYSFRVLPEENILPSPNILPILHSPISLTSKIIKDSKMFENIDTDEELSEYTIQKVNNKQLIRFYQGDFLFTKTEILELLDIMNFLDNKNLEEVFKIAYKLDYDLSNNLIHELNYVSEKVKFDGILLNKKLLVAYDNNELQDYFNDMQIFQSEIMHQIKLIFLTGNNNLLFELDNQVKDFISELDNHQISPYITYILQRDNSEALYYLFNSEIIYMDKNEGEFFDDMLRDAKKYNSIKCIETIKYWM